MKIVVTLCALAPIVFRMRDVAVLLHHQQDQRRDDVQRGDHDDQADGERDRRSSRATAPRTATCSCRPSPAVDVLGAEPRRNRLRDLRRRVDVVDAQLDQIDLCPCRAAAWRRRARRSPYVESNSNRPRLNMPTTRSRRGRGIIPIGDSVPCGVSTVHRVADARRRAVRARSLPSRMPSGSSSAAWSSASRLPARIAPLRSVTSARAPGRCP